MAGGRIRVLLIDTNPRWVQGSMTRYGKLVEKALSDGELRWPAVEILRKNLALPVELPDWLPDGVRSWLNHLWLLLTGPECIRRCSCDLVHLLDGSYAYLLDRTFPVPVTATVHDLIPALQQRGQLSAEAPSRLAGRIVDRALQGLARCRCLLAVSENSATDLMRLTDVTRDRIEVLPNALDEAFLAVAAEKRGRPVDVTGETRPMVLHIGSNAHYKNRAGALRVFARVRAAVDACLVMAGPAPSDELKQLVAKLGLENAVLFVAVSSDDQLVELYSSAAVFLFPSRYEGFGWPPLEAMACGCPVVCSNAASLPEVVGDAALTAPPEDEEQLAGHCLAILLDPALADELSRKGRERARQFTPQRMGQQLTEFYSRLLDEQS